MTSFSDASWSPDMHPSLWMARAEARTLHNEMFNQDLTITSGLRPRTLGGSSLHQVGKAMDLRSRHMTYKEQHAFADELNFRLGDDFDVIVEGPAATFDRYRNRAPHIHVEFDPKGRHAQRIEVGGS